MEIVVVTLKVCACIAGMGVCDAQGTELIDGLETKLDANRLLLRALLSLWYVYRRVAGAVVARDGGCIWLLADICHFCVCHIEAAVLFDSNGAANLQSLYVT